MKLVAATLLACALPAAAVMADPINRYTITGRSAAAATTQGVPLDQTPKPDQPAAIDAGVQDQALAQGGAAADGSGSALEPRRPRVVRYGLLGLSYRVEQ